MKTLHAILWALIIAVVFFGATHIQQQLNAEIDKRANAKIKDGWCNLDFESSKATVECNKVSRLERK